MPEALKAGDCQYPPCEVFRMKIRIEPWFLNNLGKKVHLYRVYAVCFSPCPSRFPLLLSCAFHAPGWFRWGGSEGWLPLEVTVACHGLLCIQPRGSVGGEVVLEGTAEVTPCGARGAGCRPSAMFHSISGAISPRRPPNSPFITGLSPSRHTETSVPRMCLPIASSSSTTATKIKAIN